MPPVNGRLTQRWRRIDHMYTQPATSGRSIAPGVFAAADEHESCPTRLRGLGKNSPGDVMRPKTAISSKPWASRRVSCAPDASTVSADGLGWAAPGQATCGRPSRAVEHGRNKERRQLIERARGCSRADASTRRRACARGRKVGWRDRASVRACRGHPAVAGASRVFWVIVGEAARHYSGTLVRLSRDHRAKAPGTLAGLVLGAAECLAVQRAFLRRRAAQPIGVSLTRLT